MSYEVPGSGAEVVEGDEVRLEITEGRERLRTSTGLGFCGLGLAETPLACSPRGVRQAHDGPR